MGILRAAFALILLALMCGPARAEVQIQQVTSPAGQAFWLVEEPSIPIVALRVSFPGGIRADPEGQEGLSSFAIAMMNEGSGDLDAAAFANRADDISARMGFGASVDNASVSARFLLETLDEGIDLLALALTSPRFDAEPMERVRGQMFSALEQQKTSPGSIARRTWFSQAFAGHPYGRPSGGTVESVTAVTAADLRIAHQRLFTRHGVRIGIVGAIDAARAGEIVDRLLAPLPDGAPIARARVTTSPPTGVVVKDLDVPQATAIFGHNGLRRDDPDFIPAFVMNYILGAGGFTSRLTEEVREKRGLAYSVNTSLSVYEDAELMIGSVQTANARIAETLDVIRGEWRRMAAEGVTAQELADAKTFLTGSFPLRFDSNGKIANYLVFMQSEGLSPSYLLERNGLIEAVTIEDIKRVAQRLLDADALSIVVVGKPEGL